MNKNVLIADNKVDFLNTRAEALREAGYRVFEAASPEEAERVLREVWIHVAVVDIRLKDDDDAKDTSGLLLAKNEAYRAIPKVILTGWPTYQAVRDVMFPSLGGLPPAVDFIGKHEGVEAMLEAVDRAIQQQSSIDWDLSIQSNEGGAVTFLYLAALIDPESGDEKKLASAEELEGVFRGLFQNESKISFDHLLWHRGRRVALTVSLLSSDKAPESNVVVCGVNSCIDEEALRYRNFAPKVPGRCSTVFVRSNKTLHYATNAYAIEPDVQTLKTLRDLYNSGPEKNFTTVLGNLFNSTLAEWHQHKSVLSDGQGLDKLYSDRLGIPRDFPSQSALRTRIQSIVRHLATLNAKVSLRSQQITLKFAELSFSYPDPSSILGQVSEIGQPVVLMTTPGVLDGHNVLTDPDGRAWLTDFADAGLAPSLWNYVQLEAAIRFDWVECNRLQWLHEMEQCLIDNDFTKFSVSDVERPLRKPLRAIKTIRQLASDAVFNDPLAYHLGVFYSAIKRLAHSDPEFRRSPNEIARLGHALIAASVIAGYLASAQKTTEQSREELGLRIDETNRRVWLNGRPLSLSRQSYKLLCIMYQRPNQLFKRQELGVLTFGENYNESGPNPEIAASHISRLNTAIFRLREAIERDPSHPIFLITEPSGGYRLVIRE
jgi:DNA-binding response OmpR family regulator